MSVNSQTPFVGLDTGELATQESKWIHQSWPDPPPSCESLAYSFHYKKVERDHSFRTQQILQFRWPKMNVLLVSTDCWFIMHCSLWSRFLENEESFFLYIQWHHGATDLCSLAWTLYLPNNYCVAYLKVTTGPGLHKECAGVLCW